MDKEEVIKTIQEYMQSASFTDRKVTDTPTDNLSVVNRKFVTLNGALTDRPVSSVATVGQRYYDTDNNTPIYYTVGGWRDSTGSVVAGHQ